MLLRSVYLFLVFLFRGILRLFFRRVEVVGAPPASTARRLFAANHVNGVIDPALVLTSTWCRISPLAKAPLWKVPGLNLLLKAAQAVPVVRRQDAPGKAEGANDELFSTVGGHLTRGGNILIFPEGISHSEPHVVRLRSGAARMLVGAREHGVTGMTFQAVGLEFEERETFRSRALVLFGPVRSVDDMAMKPGDDLAERITEQMTADLTELVVEGATWDERRLIGRVAQMIAHDAGDRSLAGWNVIGRQVEAARKALGARSATALYDEVARAVARYDEGLAAAAMTDQQMVSERDDEGPRAVREMGRLLLLPLALIGAALYVLPYQLPKLSTRLAHGERDVVSTYKLGLALVVFPVWALLLCVAAAVALPWPMGLAAVALVLGSPLATLPWLDWYDQMQLDSGEVVTGPAPSLQELLSRRADAMAAIGRARQSLGL